MPIKKTTDLLLATVAVIFCASCNSSQVEQSPEYPKTSAVGRSDSSSVPLISVNNFFVDSDSLFVERIGLDGNTRKTKSIFFQIDNLGGDLESEIDIYIEHTSAGRFVVDLLGDAKTYNPSELKYRSGKYRSHLNISRLDEGGSIALRFQKIPIADEKELELLEGFYEFSEWEQTPPPLTASAKHDKITISLPPAQLADAVSRPSELVFDVANQSQVNQILRPKVSFHILSWPKRLPSFVIHATDKEQ